MSIPRTLAINYPAAPLVRPHLVALPLRMEQDLVASITGTHEQSDIVFVGVTDYVWFPWGHPRRDKSGYDCSLRYELIPDNDFPELEERNSIFHTGYIRASTDVNAIWTRKLASQAGTHSTSVSLRQSRETPSQSRSRVAERRP